MKLPLPALLPVALIAILVSVPTPAHAQAAASCGGLAGADAATQVRIVESQPACAATFVQLLLADAPAYVEAFAALIASPAATESLFSAVYEELRFGRFRFDGRGLAALETRLPAAVAACEGLFRCADWKRFVLARLESGGMFRCPDVTGLGPADLLANLPYGDYQCTETIATAMGNLVLPDPADRHLVAGLIDLAQSRPDGLARRNALRAVGRLAGRSDSDAGRRIRSGDAAAIRVMLHGRLSGDDFEDVLSDAIWILDSYFYPDYDVRTHLERISRQTAFHESLRFRAARAWSRLVWAGSGRIAEAEVAFILDLLESDNAWLRAEGAFVAETLGESRLDAAMRQRIVAALESRWAREADLRARVYIAQSLDRYNGTSLRAELRASWESDHLGSTYRSADLTIRSGLPAGDLPAFAGIIDKTREVFFDVMGAGFRAPVSGDTNVSMTLLLFATQSEYADYMSLFVGYGQSAGGLYLEKQGTLYTYQRGAKESVFTAEELVQHEYGHYLTGRYVYPGLWTDAGYHAEPKGWFDEGLAEVLAGARFDADGGYLLPFRSSRRAAVCGTPPRLAPLLTRRAGYDEGGTFDYVSSWSLLHFLSTERRDTLRSLASAFRSGTYRSAGFESGVGVSPEELERDWHASLEKACSPIQPITSWFSQSPAAP